MDTIRNDLRFALRQLRRQPGFTAIAVATLAIGIGAATAVFNAAEVALYRPLPMGHQDRLVRIYRVPEAGTPWISIRPATFAMVERNGRFFDRIVGQRYTTLVRPTESGPERLVGIAVTAGWAETLGVDVHVGRTFTPDEERLGAAAGVALLSYGAWQRLFGGDPAALGRTLVLNEQTHARAELATLAREAARSGEAPTLRGRRHDADRHAVPSDLRRRGGPYVGGAAGRRVVPAAHRVREPGHPAGGEGVEPDPGAGRPGEPGRNATSPGPPAPDREPAPGWHRQRPRGAPGVPGQRAGPAAAAEPPREPGPRLRPGRAPHLLRPAPARRLRRLRRPHRLPRPG